MAGTNQQRIFRCRTGPCYLKKRPGCSHSRRKKRSKTRTLKASSLLYILSYSYLCRRIWILFHKICKRAFSKIAYCRVPKQWFTSLSTTKPGFAVIQIQRRISAGLFPNQSCFGKYSFGIYTQKCQPVCANTTNNLYSHSAIYKQCKRGNDTFSPIRCELAESFFRL